MAPTFVLLILHYFVYHLIPFLSTFVCTVASCPLSRLSAKTGFSFLLFIFLYFFSLL
jgi:hypothetical protein